MEKDEVFEYVHYMFKCGWECNVTFDDAKTGNLHNKCPYCHPQQYNFSWFTRDKN